MSVYLAHPEKIKTKMDKWQKKRMFTLKGAFLILIFIYFEPKYKPYLSNTMLLDY